VASNIRQALSGGDLHGVGGALPRAVAAGLRVPHRLGRADVARHVIQRTLNPRLSSQMTPYDVAINVRQTVFTGSPSTAKGGGLLGNLVILSKTNTVRIALVAAGLYISSHLTFTLVT